MSLRDLLFGPCRGCQAKDRSDEQKSTLWEKLRLSYEAELAAARALLKSAQDKIVELADAGIMARIQKGAPSMRRERTNGEDREVQTQKPVPPTL